MAGKNALQAVHEKTDQQADQRADLRQFFIQLLGSIPIFAMIEDEAVLGQMKMRGRRGLHDLVQAGGGSP